jgi:molecular chaperone DnaJ
MAKNYYIILGLSNNASDEDIRSAYRTLAKEYHPDHYGKDSERFLQIQEAYGVLSDPSRKRAYDQSIRKRKHRSEIVRDVTEETFSRTFAEPITPGANPVRDVHLTRSFNTFTPSFDEISDHLWSNFLNPNRSSVQTHRPMNVDIPLSLPEARRGGQVRIYVPAEAICPTCKGQGYVGFRECRRCAGEGKLTGDYPVAVEYPGGIVDGHTTMIPLGRLGIHNTYITVRFRVIREVYF